MPNELDHLHRFAAAARRGGFGASGFKLDGTTGEYHRFGKTEKMNGERWVAVPADLMEGWQRIEKGKPPLYVVGRVADGYRRLPREELGDLAEYLWPNGKDPWTPAVWLPFWHPETREVLLFHAANEGSRAAIANPTEAYALACEAHPDQLNFDPLIDLASDSYESKHGRRIYNPILEVVDWVERPAAVRRVIPPPVNVLELTAEPQPQLEYDPSDPFAEPEPAAPAKARPKKKKPDPDDGIRF